MFQHKYVYVFTHCRAFQVEHAIFSQRTQDLVFFLCHCHKAEGHCSLTYMQRDRTSVDTKSIWGKQTNTWGCHFRTAEKCCSDSFLRDQSVKRGRKTPHDRSELCNTAVTTHPLWMEEIKASVFYSAFPPLICIQFISMLETESFVNLFRLLLFDKSN